MNADCFLLKQVLEVTAFKGSDEENNFPCVKVMLEKKLIFGKRKNQC